MVATLNLGQSPGQGRIISVELLMKRLANSTNVEPGYIRDPAVIVCGWHVAET
jgi:hypothetical protein